MANIVEIIYRARDEVSRVARDVEKSSGGVAGGFDKSRVAMIAFNAIAGTVTVGALAKMITSTAALANRMAELQASTGIAGTSLSRWKAVAESSGSSLESLVTAMRALSTQAYQDAEAFAQLGVQVRDSNGNLRPLESLLNDTIRALQNTANQTERMALATRTLGRGALDLAPLLAMSTQELEALQRQADETGATMSQKLILAAKEWDDEMDRSANIMRGFKNSLGESVLSPLTEVVKAFNDALSAKRRWEQEATRAFPLPPSVATGEGRFVNPEVGGAGARVMGPVQGPPSPFVGFVLPDPMLVGMGEKIGRGFKRELEKPSFLYPPAQGPLIGALPGEIGAPRLLPEFQRPGRMVEVPAGGPETAPGLDFGRWGQEVQESFKQVGYQFGASIQDTIKHSKNFGDGLNKLSRQALRSFEQAVLANTAALIADRVARAAGGFLRKLLGFQTGGIVPHVPGASADRDSVPAMLQPGEMVLSRQMVQSLLRPARVSGGIAHFAAGGASGPGFRFPWPDTVSIPYITPGGETYYRRELARFFPGMVTDQARMGHTSSPSGLSRGSGGTVINAEIAIPEAAYGTHLDRMRFAFDVREALESLSRNSFSNLYPNHT